MAKEIRREFFNFLIALVFIVVLLGILGEMMFHAWIFDGVYYLLTGWVFYPLETASEVTIDWTSVATAGVAIVLFTIVLHVFLRWLLNSARRAAARPPWTLRGSLRIVSLIVFSFVAGMSMVGIVHQITWLATTDETLTEHDFPTFQTVSPPASNPN